MESIPELNLLAQVVHPKYREALQLAASAFDVPAPASDKQAPLPLIFGSPEYLQVDFCMTQQITSRQCLVSQHACSNM